MASISEQSEEPTTEGTVGDNCYLLSLPREIRDKIWCELFLRDYALFPRIKGLIDYAHYRGDEESNPFKSKGYRRPVKQSNEIFVPRLFYIMNHVGGRSAAARSDQMPEDPQLRAVFGVELLRTCKQICEEGLNVLYGMNAFQFDTFRHLKYMKPFRKWIQPTRFKNGTSMMWSSQTLTALSGLFDPLEEPEKVLYRPIQCFVRSIGKGNAARITVIHFRITLTPFGPFMPSSSQPHDTSKFIEKHNLIFNHTLTSLKELRIAGYWDDSLGKRALSVQRKWQSSPNNRVHYPIPGDLQSSQLFCKVTKNVETFAKRVPQGNFNQLHSNPSISLRPVLWSDIIELRKMNQRRDDNPTETSAD